MKKRILALFLAVVMLVSVYPMKTSAFISTPGRVEGVNYTRIEENELLCKDVTFYFGEIKIMGELINGKILSEEEVDEVIREVMRTGSDTVITSKMLVEAENRITDAKNYDKKRYVNPSVISELAISLGGISNGDELSQMMHGERPVETSLDYYQNVLTNTGLAKLFDMALGKALGSEILAFLLGAAKTVTQVGAREYMEYVASEEELVRAMAAAVALEKFYALCNREIKKKEKESGQNNWRIKCSQTVNVPVSLFNIGGNKQYWRLVCDLKLQDKNEDPMDWGGTYKGNMELRLWHDLSAFDDAFYGKIYKSASLPFTKLRAEYNTEDEYKSASSLTKTLTNPSFTIRLDPGLAYKGSIEQTFSLKEFEDRTSFWSYHPILAKPNWGLMDDGHLDADKLSDVLVGEATHQQKDSFAGEVMEGNFGVRMDWYQWEFEGSSDIADKWGHGHTVENNTQNEGMGQQVAKDTKIFEELRTVPELRIEGLE